MKIKFNYDYKPRKKGEIAEFVTKQELKIAEFYTNAGIAIEYKECDDCKDGKKGCKDCGDVDIVNETKEEVKEVKKRTTRKKKVNADNN